MSLQNLHCDVFTKYMNRILSINRNLRSLFIEAKHNND